MRVIDHFHGRRVYPRRIRVLSDHLVKLIPLRSRILDIGCGDGLLARTIMQRRPDVEARGLDVLVRSQTCIPVDAFNGQAIPHPDASFDMVMLIDVLHHTQTPMVLLHEAVRVARKAILVKDHTRNGVFAEPTLRLMDWVGNARHGVALPYTYWSQERWFEAFDTLDLTVGAWMQDLGLYPRAFDWFVGRSLHFVARLDLNEVDTS